MQDGGYGELENWRKCNGCKIIDISPIWTNKKLPLCVWMGQWVSWCLGECGYWGSVLGVVFSCRWKSHVGAITACHEIYCAYRWGWQMSQSTRTQNTMTRQLFWWEHIHWADSSLKHSLRCLITGLLSYYFTSSQENSTVIIHWLLPSFVTRTVNYNLTPYSTGIWLKYVT